ncbi:PRA1 family protein B3-like [Alnus glutinosa]|uniref:PRA1 family protein B3-like n=1 Tax=Alnus glutinosa TaxID=3517 RepID=UPI002D78BABF|nr:PRA1 family protein B3-like [Alnus glutinosa]
MASPPTLPISNPQTTGESQQSTTTTPTPTPTPFLRVRTFITRLFGYTRRALSNRRPWIELVDRNSFSRPDSLSEATSRVRKNFSYFRINYLTLLALVLAVSLLYHPFTLLLLLSLLAAWLFLYAYRPSDQPLVILGRTFSDGETLIGLILLTVIVVFLTSAGSLLISAGMVGMAIVAAHGAFRVPEDLFLDDQDPSGSSGLFSYIGGVASSAAATAGPAVMSRV